MANNDIFYGPNGASGEKDGTGSAIPIQLNFKPSAVTLMNIDDAGGFTKLEWIAGMPAASGVKTVDSGAGVTNLSYISSNGITVGSGGFTIGTDTDVNVSAETIHWEARR